MTTIMQPFQCDLQPQIPRHPINTHAVRQKKSKPTAAATAAHRRYLSSPAAATLHGKTQGFVLRLLLPNTSPMQHSCSHYNAFCSITSQTCTYLRTWQHQMTTIMQPFQCDLQPQIPKHPITTHAQAHPKQLEATVTVRQKNRQTDRSRNRRTQEVPFILPAAATLHGKTQGFVLRLPPQNKAHSTFMLSLQCVLQHHVANLHVSTHMATPDDNNHAAIPMRSATTDSKTPKNYARTSTPKAA